MKNFYRTIIFVLLASLLLSAVACKKKTGYNYIVSDAGYDFINCGITDYTLVISRDIDKHEKFAADELNFFLNEAVNITLPVKYDDEVSYNKNNKHISIGRNKLFEASGLKPKDGDLQSSGYIIKTMGNTVFLTGSSYKSNNYGVIYSVYGFLKHLINLEIYAENVYTFDDNQTVKMKHFDVTELPDFDWRRIGFYNLNQSDLYTFRMGLVTNYELPFVSAHSHFSYISPNNYPDHPEWFTPGKEQLRLVNEEMTAEFIEQVKRVILANPSATLIHFGLMDKRVVDESDEARRILEQYNTNHAGINIMFVNKVVDAVDAWLAEEHPDRNISYRTLIYFDHLEPPVKYNTKTKRYDADHEAVIPRKNVRLWIAPIGMVDYSKPITAQENQIIYDIIKGWSAISNNLSIWNYAMNFNNFQYNFNDISSFSSNLKFGLENGLTGWYQQGALETFTASFQEMRIYVQSKLMWNTDLSYEELAHKFIKAYYGPAAEAVLEYFNLTLTNNVRMRDELKIPQGVFSDIDKAAAYPFEYVNKLAGIMQSAEDALLPLKQISQREYDDYHNRLRIQKITVLFMQLQHHSSYYDSKKLTEMIDQLEETAIKNGIIKFKETGSLQSYLNIWRSKIV